MWSGVLNFSSGGVTVNGGRIIIKQGCFNIVSGDPGGGSELEPSLQEVEVIGEGLKARRPGGSQEAARRPGGGQESARSRPGVGQGLVRTPGVGLEARRSGVGLEARSQSGGQELVRRQPRGRESRSLGG